MKINLSHITVKTLDEQELQFDIRNEFSNHLYLAGRNLQEVELARRLYYSRDDDDVNEEEAKFIIETAKKVGYIYLIRKAIAENLGIKIE